MIEWIKKNKIIAILLIAVAYILISLGRSFFGLNLLSLSIPSTSKSTGQYTDDSVIAPEASLGSVATTGLETPSFFPRGREYAPQTDIDERLVIQESNVSLLVKNVTEIRNKIVNYTQTNGGYMVSSNISNPQDAPTATVIIRIPSEKLEGALDHFRSLSVKVVSENLLGRDVTDQYIDIDTRIAQIQRTKTRLESILDQATEISDITNLTQQILSYQNQIDSYKGQQDALQKNAQLAKLTIYLSTDEIALPYAPSETFRPAVIFKLAVRSLVKSLRGLATMGIWLGVYSVIWVPALVLFIFVKKLMKNRKHKSEKEGNP